MTRIAYVNGDFIPLENARISILDRGFLFADGIYEVSAVLDGKLVDNDSHLTRLERSLGEIRLTLPLDLASIEALQLELIRRNALVNGIVYLQVTRGAGERNFLFPDATLPSLVMFTQMKDIAGAPGGTRGIAIKTVEDIRWQRRDIKNIGLLAQVLAKQVAAEAGCAEAWMTEGGRITEGASSSAFIITQDNVIVTRPDSNTVLPGCTAKAVVQLAEEANLVIEHRAFTLAEALEAKEAFMTSASTFVQPVIKIDNQNVGSGEPGPLTQRLRAIYINFARQVREPL
ncbi:D-amino-acid transaminase [Phyllobacterium sp. SB3]|uniref:D-amino-acid transaminase n=1 Tax=Phyllobacterium sp. SB3 TaxID=3156073 RepID=UPI0032AF8174